MKKGCYSHMVLDKGIILNKGSTQNIPLKKKQNFNNQC